MQHMAGPQGCTTIMFFKVKSPLRKFLRTLFGLGCTLVLIVTTLYHYPHPNTVVYFVTVRPAWAWFALLMPIIVAGAAGIRPRWVICGCALWWVGFLLSEEIGPLFRLAPTKTRKEFLSLRTTFQEKHLLENTQVIPLRLVTWNLEARTNDRGWAGTVSQFEELAKLEPDIVFLQETTRQGLLSHVLEESVRFSSDRLARRGDNAILTRFPIETAEDQPLDLEHGLVANVCVSPGLGVTCINVHYPGPGVTIELLPWRLRRGGSLSEWVATTDSRLRTLEKIVDRHAHVMPVIVAGDFNLPANYVSLRRSLHRLTDSFLAGGHGWGKTFIANAPFTRIDMIYVPCGTKVVDSRAISTTVSDHRMVVSDVVLKADVANQQEGTAGSCNKRS